MSERTNNGWEDFEAGAVLFSFKSDLKENVSLVPQKQRDYNSDSTFTKNCSDWRVNKPLYNADFCIHCQNCWLACPDTSIVSREKKMIGVDYNHCKGCGVCADVCPTNPKSLIMFEEYVNEDEAFAGWPQKEKKKKGGEINGAKKVSITRD